MSNNIVKFPKRPDENDEFELDYEAMYHQERKLREEELAQRGHSDGGSGGGWTLWNITKLILAVVRIPVFFVLYFLRVPVVLVCNLLYFPMFLLSLFAWYAFPAKPQMWASFGVISVVAFLMLYLYDLLLSWLSPTEMVHTL